MRHWEIYTITVVVVVTIMSLTLSAFTYGYWIGVKSSAGYNQCYRDLMGTAEKVAEYGKNKTK